MAEPTGVSMEGRTDIMEETAKKREPRNYLVLDLEMCKVTPDRRKAEYRHKNEIIQIGAVLMDSGFHEISRFCTYVKPQYGVIDWYIADLTGIHDSHIKHAPGLREAMASMLGWLNGIEADVYTWSESDFRQLSKELKAKDIDGEAVDAFMDPERWHDYQKTFGERYHFNRNVSLKEAMDLIDLSREGRAHDGLEDAWNTGRLIAKLEQDPELKLTAVYEDARSKEKETLSFSLGGLLAGLHMEFPA